MTNQESHDAASDVQPFQSQAQGLESPEAERRLREYGPNKLPEAPLPGLAAIFFRQFLSPFIYILLIAALVSYFLGQLSNAVFIMAVLLLNAIIGTIQEYSAQRSASALRNMVRGEAHVIRDGIARRIDVEALVPGDLVLLSSGDKVPADIRLETSQSLSINESMLTGESLAVTKNAQAEVPHEAPLAERSNQCFAGTTVTHGRGQGVVTTTGLDTELGHIAHAVNDTESSEAPLIIRIRRFTYQMAGAIAVALLLLVGLMFVRGGYGTEGMMLMAIGLAVSTIPEGLPAALTVALAIGMRRMAQHSVIIRRLVAVEALGSCTFICSDKTGTLTVNDLTIRHAVLADGSTYNITGEGVAPGGEVIGEDPSRLEDMCITGLLANESYLDYSGGEWVSDGDIVDVAFLVLAKKLGLSLSDIRERRARLDLIPYESERAFSGSLNKGDEHEHYVLHVKGSPEKLLNMCSHMSMPDGDVPLRRAAIEAQFEDLATRGYRMIALARYHTDDEAAIEHLGQMTFLGMVAMIDPVRPEAKEAVQRCRQGGIQVAMITGDHPATSRAIALELGLCREEDPVVTGAMIREATTKGVKALDDLIRPTRVFARIEPTQKEQIVDRLIRKGHFVAVTGDGVNDTPAMRRANAGIAMGKRGTDVAKETADLIITDDNFASIVDGIEQGRIVYNNIRKVIALLTATGFSALLLFFLTVFAGLPMPMIAVQLLWLNLVANGFQDVALAFEPGEGGELDQHPRNPHEPIFEKHIIQHVLVTGTTMGVLAFATYAYLMHTGSDVGDARNLTLMLMVLFGNIHALSSRSETRSLFQIRFFSNPFLVLAVPLAQLVHIAAMYTPGISDILAIKPISLEQWSILLVVALLLFAVEELHKLWLRRQQGLAPAGKTSTASNRRQSDQPGDEN
ncbi:cation-translocating P-type ATPase [Halomonas aquatica]|uniref:HAD-IC family P-type ATPase n=1 Tax=Halomonas aquatica TaxID=3151123 RepID=A0ABV1NGP2_9GAMM